MHRCLAHAAVVSLCTASLAAADWKPADGPLFSRWAQDVSPDSVHGEYPRPQMVREDWVNLNGLWDHAIRPRGEEVPSRFEGKILVPFAVESALSGVKKPVGEANRLWYRRTFQVPELKDGGRLLLHFGAVDWHAVVWINGKKVGEHKGGYDPFSFDITDALSDASEQEVVVGVWDPTDAGFQPRGKQVNEPRGIWYTAVTGIWQTVWLEPVPATRIESLKILTDIDSGSVSATVRTSGARESHRVDLRAAHGGRVHRVRGRPDRPVALKVNDARLWSPAAPNLYDLTVTLLDGDEKVDEVESYFGMREVSIGKGKDGFNRLLLNGEPLFHFGPLDQGWWPDGLYTAPTDAALRYDIEVTRMVGFNMARKHVKVEPARWYYHCDRLGLMVWQDLPNGDRHISPRDPDIERSSESAENYMRELKAMIDSFHNHPSIVVWVPFNEGWGQFDTDRVLRWTKEYDATRLVDGPSGWADRGSGDIHDMHRYPGPAMPEPEEKRAIVLGEFGGLGLPLAGHLWWDRRNWGYRTYRTHDELRVNYHRLMRRLHPLIGRGLAGAIYTQTTDVEGEVNGLMTYDRALIKMDADELARLHRRLYQPPPVVTVKTLVPSSEKSAQMWRYTTEKPAEGWQAPGFDDSSWKEGPGGFGEETTPGTVVRTAWTSSDIWMRRTFELTATDVTDLHVRAHHDEDARIYLNGELILSLDGYVTEYTEFLPRKQTRALLRSGTNTIAVHCHQTGGGQYIDVGLVDVIEKHPE